LPTNWVADRCATLTKPKGSDKGEEIFYKREDRFNSNPNEKEMDMPKEIGMSREMNLSAVVADVSTCKPTK
jgi:hypothetical protein